MRNPTTRIGAPVASLPLLASALVLGGAAATAAAEDEVAPIEIIGVTPMPGTGVERDRVPTAVQTLESSDFETFAPRNLTGLMEQRLSGVTVKDVQNSPYQ